jgi:hypothetical protein
MAQQGAALQNYNNELVKCNYYSFKKFNYKQRNREINTHLKTKFK